MLKYATVVKKENPLLKNKFKLSENDCCTNIYKSYFNFKVNLTLQHRCNFFFFLSKSYFP